MFNKIVLIINLAFWEYHWFWIKQECQNNLMSHQQTYKLLDLYL